MVVIIQICRSAEKRNRKKLKLTIAILAMIAIISEGLAVHCFNRLLTLKRIAAKFVNPGQVPLGYIIACSIFQFLHVFCGNLSRLLFMIQYLAVTVKIRGIINNKTSSSAGKLSRCQFKAINYAKWVLSGVYLILSTMIATVMYLMFTSALTNFTIPPE